MVQAIEPIPECPPIPEHQLTANKTANVRVVLTKAKQDLPQTGLFFAANAFGELPAEIYCATIQQYLVSEDGSNQDWVDVPIIFEE